MEELIIDTFYLEEKEEYKHGEERILKIAPNLYVKVLTYGTRRVTKDSEIFRQFKLVVEKEREDEC